MIDYRTLGHSDIQSACAYQRNGSGTYTRPEWCEEYNFAKDYSPSYNIAPTEVTPVLTSASNFGLGDADERILKPMMWGIVPKWHKNTYKNHGLSTNNCRIENVLSSRLYSGPLKKGNRCIILAEGFYEWQTTTSSKQPYFIFSSQVEGSKMEDISTFDNTFNEDDGWNGVNLLKMAGLYNEWSNEEGVLYSYTVITMPSNSQLDWLHHRMPAVLETEQQIADWLDVERVSYLEAVASLKPALKLSSYPVSTLVNNSREKSPNCKTPIDCDNKMRMSSKKRVGSRSLMENWLKGNKQADKSHNV